MLVAYPVSANLLQLIHMISPHNFSLLPQVLFLLRLEGQPYQSVSAHSLSHLQIQNHLERFEALLSHGSSMHAVHAAAPAARNCIGRSVWVQPPINLAKFSSLYIQSQFFW